MRNLWPVLGCDADISEVAKYANPPSLVKLVIEALCVMFQIPPAKVGEAGKKMDDYWYAAADACRT
jgi:dynein heavy chain